MVHWVAGVVDHIALTGRVRLKAGLRFLVRVGASVGETWMAMDMVGLVITSQGRRVQALPIATPVDRCTASAIVL